MEKQQTYPVTYQVIRKPLYDRLIDAACIYWSVDAKENWFGVSGKLGKGNRLTPLRKILFYVLLEDASLTVTEIAKMFSVNVSVVTEHIEFINHHLRINRTITEDIKQLKQIAANLDCNVITKHVALSNE